MANVLFGKLGQKIVYDRGLSEAIRSNTNGNYESYNMLRILSVTLDTVFVVNDNILMSLEQQLLDDSIKLITDFVPKIDCAFILLGVDENNMSKKLLSIINSGIKWYALCSDPRCLNALTKYITNPPIDVYAGAVDLDCEIAGKMFKTKYLNMEAANVYGEVFPIRDSYKHDGLVVIANQTNTWDRIGHIKDMTKLIPKNKVIVYGRCKEEDKDERFIGEFPIQHIYNSQLLSKVTYIAPISPGWITAKYIESIYRGVIPLISNNYATLVFQFILDIYDIDANLFVQTPAKLLEQYLLIVNNHDYYNKVICSLRELVYSKYSPVVLRDNLLKLI